MKKRKVFDNVEVHDMKDLKSGNSRSSTETQGASPIWKAVSVVVAMLALAYDVSPIDAVPDAIPVLGLIDDVGFTLMAALNVYQQFAANQNSALIKLVKYVKWILVALVVIAVVVAGGIISLIVHLITQG